MFEILVAHRGNLEVLLIFSSKYLFYMDLIVTHCVWLGKGLMFFGQWAQLRHSSGYAVHFLPLRLLDTEAVCTLVHKLLPLQPMRP